MTAPKSSSFTSASLTPPHEHSTSVAGSNAAPAEIARSAGGSFSVFGGHIVGRQLELVPDRRIVQAWRVVDWPPGIYSIAKFELTDRGGKTQLVFDHTGFPTGLGEHLAQGWRANYWGRSRSFSRRTVSRAPAASRSSPRMTPG